MHMPKMFKMNLPVFQLSYITALKTSKIRYIFTFMQRSYGVLFCAGK